MGVVGAQTQVAVEAVEIMVRMQVCPRSIPLVLPQRVELKQQLELVVLIRMVRVCLDRGIMVVV